MFVDQLEEVDSHRKFEGSGVLDVPADTEEFRPRALLGADLLVGIDTDLEDVGQVGEGLDVVDHRRATKDPFDGRKGRFEFRLPSLSLQGGEHSRFLATDVGTRPAMKGNIEVEVAAEDPLAEKTIAVRLLDSFEEPPVGEDEFPANVDVGVVNPDRLATDDDSIEEQVGVLLHQNSVLEGARFRFVGVDHQVLRLVGVLRNEGPLDPGRESRSATAAKIGGLHQIDEGIRVLVFDGILCLGVAALLLVELECVAVFLSDMPCQDFLEGHQEDPPSGNSARHCSMSWSTSSRSSPSW